MRRRLLVCSDKAYLGSEPTGCGTKETKPPSAGLLVVSHAPPEVVQGQPDQPWTIYAAIRSILAFGLHCGSLSERTSVDACGLSSDALFQQWRK